MEEWKLTKIGSLCKRVCSGGTPKSTIEEYFGGDIPWLNTKEVNFNRIYSTESTISDAGLNNSSAKWIDKHSVIVAMYGATAAKCAIGMIPMTTNQACCNLMVDENLADYRFIYYALTNSYSTLASLANGGAQQNLNAQLIKDFEIPLPDLHTQHRIADILTSIDDKIENNNRINHNLEEQADGIVSSLLNVGTTVLRLSDICKYVSQKIDCQSLTLDNYISTENMVPSRGGVTKSSNVPTGTAIEYSSGDILVSNIRPYFQKIWKATYSGGCSNDVLCFRSSTNSPSFLYHLLRQNSFFDHVMAGAKGSKMPRGDKAQIMNWTFVLSEDWEAMESKLSIIDKKVALLRVQNLMLIELRDSVLPRLMSGELKINDLTC